jgi:hypothetical protein
VFTNKTTAETLNEGVSPVDILEQGTITRGPFHHQRQPDGTRTPFRCRYLKIQRSSSMSSFSTLETHSLGRSSTRCRYCYPWLLLG